MTAEPTGRLGRRAVIAAGIGGMVAAVAGALGRPAAVLAADGDPVKIGALNAGTQATVIDGGPSEGLRGVSTGADGVVGEASVALKSGIYGQSSHADGFGVAGRNTATGAVGVLGGADGFWGEATLPIRSGAFGRSKDSMGFGVVGHNDVTGTEGQLGAWAGVVAKPGPGTGAPALSVEGPCVFRDSGVVTVAAGKSSVLVSGVMYTGTPFVLAMLQRYRAGVYVAAAVPNKSAGTLTIYLNKKVTTAIAVGYWVAS